MVWWIFTKDVPLDKLEEIRDAISVEPEPDHMSDRITQLSLMGGVSQAVGGG